MKNRVITISREFGSGGRTIGRLPEDIYPYGYGVPCRTHRHGIRRTEQSPEEHKDKRRAAYHRFYTNMKWGHAQNYHLTLNSGVLGIDQCVEIISELF